MKEYIKRETCAVCESKDLKTILKLGYVPLAGNFPKKDELVDTKMYDLNLLCCEKCKLVQTDSIISPDILFKDYRYSSSISLTDYFQSVANMIDNKYDLKNCNILEIGCNDGVLMKPLKEKGAIVLGIDPAENIVKLGLDKGLNIICDYFSYDNAIKYNMKEKFDIIIANNSFAHIPDIKNILKGIYYSLKDNGVFIFEVHYLNSLIELNQWDNIYHEHMYYYSVTSIEYFMKMFNMKIINFEEITNHSGSIRFYVQKNSIDLGQKIIDKIKIEKDIYLKLDEFSKNTISHIQSIKDFIKELKSKNQKIIGYGSSGRANMFCNIIGLTNDDIDYIVDESPERYNRFIPKSNIPIIPKEDMTFDADYVFIFAWNYSSMIMKKLKDYNFKYIIAFPEVQIVDNYEQLQNKTGL